MDINKLYENLTVKIKLGNEMVESLTPLKTEGVFKLRNKFKQELAFLHKLQKNGTLKQEHLNCSNLNHLHAVASKFLENQLDCTAVMCNKALFLPSGTTKRIRVDLVLKGGAVWMKIVARNSKALSLVSNGEGSFGQKSIVDQAVEFIACSKQHLYYFQPPQVTFYFANGIEDSLAEELTELGVTVLTQESTPNVCSDDKDQHFVRDKENMCDSTDVSEIVKYPIREFEICRNLQLISEMKEMRLNLGVTTLIAYTSALTNGGNHYTFNSDVLNQHAQWERARPVKPILDALFAGRKLFACESAIEDFQNILQIIGGKNEKQRAEELLKRVEIVQDMPTDKLKNGNKIKYRSRAIFGTGEYLEAITVTANHAFVRSARNQGVEFAVFLHESRALTEGKQPITDN